jgi:hypothetical protein
MELFVVSFSVLMIAVAAMAVGVMFGRNPIAGSCGGLNVVDGKCGSCTRPCTARRKAARDQAPQDGVN